MGQLLVVKADDSVVVHSKGRFLVEIKRETIMSVFPHVVNNERVLKRLVGQKAELPISLTFYFNMSDQITKCDIDIDFATAFVALLHDPRDVAELLGRALIADNCFIELKLHWRKRDASY